MRHHLRERTVTAPSGDHGTARVPSILSASHLSDYGIIMTFAARAAPTFLLLLAWPACTGSSLRMSLRRCRCHTSSSGTQQIPPANIVSFRRAGLWSLCDIPAQPSVFWPPATSPIARSMIPPDWLSSTGGLFGTVWIPSWRACATSLANASIASSLSLLSVTLLCPSPACGKDGIGMTTKAGGLTQGCAPRRDVKKWSTSIATRCTSEVCPRETGKVPIKTGWAETDKGQPGKPKVRARWVAKEYKTHTRPELYASTPPLEALEVVLSEIATGKRGGKFVALVDVRRA